METIGDTIVPASRDRFKGIRWSQVAIIIEARDYTSSADRPSLTRDGTPLLIAEADITECVDVVLVEDAEIHRFVGAPIGGILRGRTDRRLRCPCGQILVRSSVDLRSGGNARLA